jgi:hypothetical protein
MIIVFKILLLVLIIFMASEVLNFFLGIIFLIVAGISALIYTIFMEGKNLLTTKN